MINKKKLMIYDEDENLIDSSALNNTKNFIAILHINGLKFSSKKFSSIYRCKRDNGFE